MIKPVRIIENEKIHTFNERVRGGLEHALNFMMGDDSKIQISGFEPFLMPVETYLHAYKKKSVMIKIHSDRDYKGELYWFFEMPTAVALGSLMRMMPPSAIDEKLASGEFDAADQDAFGEVGNQLSGILDRAFRSLTRKDIHLKMDFEKKVYPNETIQLSSFRNYEEYVVLLTNITIPKRGSQKITLLLPRSLYEVMLNLEVSLEGITPKKVLIYSFKENSSESVRTALNSRTVKVISLENADEVLTAIDQEGVAAVGIDLKRLTFPLGHADNILLKRLASNRSLARVPYFLTWEEASPEEAKILAQMGLNGATTGSFLNDFPNWAKALL
jgi:chemotaxis protein CheY-P-specific phosphatase CheC